MRSRGLAHHSHVAWSGSDEEFQESRDPTASLGRGLGQGNCAVRKQAGLPKQTTTADRRIYQE